MPRTLVRLLISGGVFAVFLIHTAGLLPVRLLETIENFTYDARILLTLPNTVDPRVVVIDLDEKSIAAEGQWPWPRDKLATLVTHAFDKYGVAVLGFDVFFTEPDKRSPLQILNTLSEGAMADVPGLKAKIEAIKPQLDYDDVFAQAIRGKPVVMGTYMKSQLSEGETAEVGRLCAPIVDPQATDQYVVNFIEPVGFGANIAALQSFTPYCGYTDNPTVDIDGVYRRVPLLQKYKGALYPSLALAMVNVAAGNPGLTLEFDPPEARGSLNLERVRIGTAVAPVDGVTAAYVPYRGEQMSFPYISATDVIRGTADASKLKGTLALVGTTAPGLKDLRVTPVGAVYPGVEVHANIVSGFLDGRIKQKAPYYAGIEAVLLVLIGLTMALLFTRLSPLGTAGALVGMMIAVAALAFWLWSANFIMPMGVPMAYTVAVFLAQLLYGYFIESRGKRQVSKLFGQYVPPELVEEMALHPEGISMEGESRDMSVLFSDVRDFTSISEKLEAKDLAAMMNAYLTKQTAVVQKYRGTIDKYIGDAIMAFWGAPLSDKDHALNAVKAGMEMCAAVRELDQDFVKRGWPQLHIGVGINTGKMNVGNMGSSFRMAYTVMGDSVNLGARLEGLTKTYGVGLLVSEYTRNQLPSDWAFREVDVVRVKGKKEPVAIYEPMGPKEALDPAIRQDLARQRGAMQLYRKQKWDDAEQEFFNLKTGPNPQPIYDIFLERILWLRENPPGANWDGAFTFTAK